ncbi:16S rRNA (uracil(1498)-N(3))-methyltransferase [Corynebacterium hansenii]|uniref:Ribosomal RNA small subunit methyltransferase E n=1 Tax=Corynebacterium hansenii TaxID=394964 RepID=A0ABV7ZQA0_9CORY|nr:16S rRNA (uracil(1498)-N(3))-methyltransferase [Corynebacterium hansenii]WJZ00526.1 Ribosomal RNA small subunit methyltransferase E [Corynebacterium hansenii]
MGLPVFLAGFGDALPEPGATVELGGPEAKHVKVQRLGAGDEVFLVDGADRRALVRISLADGSRVACEVISAGVVERPTPHVTVVQALPKSDRAELAVDLMTEAGVDAIVPWAARRCVAKWTGAKAGKAREKWASTAREAAKQARRAWIPPVAELHSTKDVVALVEDVVGRGGVAAVLHEAERRPFAEVAAAAADAGEIVFVVGPEGGVDDEELELFRAAGATPVVLGPTVLRTALAGAAATSALGPLTRRWS